MPAEFIARQRGETLFPSQFATSSPVRHRPSINRSIPPCLCGGAGASMGPFPSAVSRDSKDQAEASREKPRGAALHRRDPEDGTSAAITGRRSRAGEAWVGAGAGVNWLATARVVLTSTGLLGLGVGTGFPDLLGPTVPRYRWQDVGKKRGAPEYRGQCDSAGRWPKLHVRPSANVISTQ